MRTTATLLTVFLLELWSVAGESPHTFVEKHFRKCERPTAALTRVERVQSPWSVSSESDGIHVGYYKKSYLFTKQTRSGVFVGIDRGEWGGSLSYIPWPIYSRWITNQTVLSHSVLTLEDWDGELSAFLYDYLKRSCYVAIIDADVQKAKCVARVVCDVPNYGRAFLPLTNGLAVAMSDAGIFLVAKDGRKNRIYEFDGLLRARNPYTLAITNDGYLYVGMVKYILRLRLDTKAEKVLSEDWFEPVDMPGYR